MMTAYVLFARGELERVRGANERALPYLQRSAAIFEKHLKGPQLESGDAFTALAIVLRDLGRYPEAEATFDRAVKAWGQVEVTGTFDLADTLEQYATLMRMTGRGPEADQILARARSAREAKAARQRDALR